MPKPRERPAGFDPMAGIGDQLDVIYGTHNPQGVQDSYPTREIEVAVIQTNPFQPRKEFDPEELEGLAQSLRNHQVLQPLLVTFRDGIVYCVSGERRLRAAKLAGLRTILCVVRENLTDDQLADLALEENMHRSNLTPLEEAYALQGYMQRNHLNAREAAERRGLSRTTINNRLALIRYPEIAQAVADGRLSASQAVQLTNSLERPGQTTQRQAILATLAAGESLTEAQIAAALGIATGAQSAPSAPPPAPGVPPNTGVADHVTAPPPPPISPEPTTRLDSMRRAPEADLSAPVVAGTAPATPPSPAADRLNTAPKWTEQPGATAPSAEVQQHLAVLQDLDNWLSRAEFATWLRTLPSESLAAYLAHLEHLQQHLPRAIAAVQTQQESMSHTEKAG